ncbi:MAG: AhpC/TSA family protein [Gallionella sp.]|jgi:peroxiredoxin|nr:AhpC/TSA family protein [Gallionella sp.]MCK9353730.1 AhpC/TSA family protein [Gallionella sp.]
MNLIKSIFISSYMMAIMSIAGYAGWALYRGENQLAWGGVLLTVAPILTVIMRAMTLKNLARTSAHFPLINLLGVAGAALAGYIWVSTGTEGLVALLATAGWTTFLLYAYWFSTYDGRDVNAKLAVGATLPEFSVRNTAGAWVSSRSLTDKPAVFIFYRGNWCPFCMAQIKELAERYREIGALGVRIALIAPQPHDNTVALAQKFRLEASFEFLTDEDNAAARKLGIEHPNGLPAGMQMLGYDSDTVMPTVVITGRNGRILWAHETDNYRVRPEPDTYLEVLRRHGAVAA